MKKVSVEVLEDASHPEGGFAVIVLHGVTTLPDGATFRLKPVEARGGADNGTGEVWPKGEQRPRAVRRSEAGIELLIGPDIVESPALLPGTLGVIELQAAGVRGEFLWPSIRPTARPRRRNLTVVKPQTAKPVASKPKETARAAPVREAENAKADVLAQLTSARRVREASSGTTLAPRADAGADATAENVPVTALDHAVPATATVAEAIGANVVAFNVVRSASGGASGDLPGASARASRATSEAAGRGAVAWQRLRTNGGNALSTGKLRAIAIAAGAAVIVSGGFLWLLDEPELVNRAVKTRNEAAQVVQRAEAMPRVESGESAGNAQPPVAPQRDAALAPEMPSDTPVVQPAPVVAAAPVVPAPALVPSQEVTLRMRGGGFQISGDLKGFDGAKYVIETRSAGVLTMDAARFECVGDACGRPAAAILPLSERPSPVKPDVFRIEGAAALAAEFVPQLIRDYALSIGATYAELPRAAGQSATRHRLSDQRGAELATIEVQATGTAAALTALERGATAIALVDRPQPDIEPRVAPAVRSRPGQPPAQPTEIVVGLDGVAVVASPSSTTASIHIDLLAKVLAGTITDWYELGQSPGAIQLYLPPDGTGTMEAIGRQVMRPRGLEVSRTVRRMTTEAEAADAAARDPRGLAVVSLATQRAARVINLETACGIVVRPSSFSVKTGEYPLVRRLSLQLPPQLAQPSARGIVRIAQSGEVHNAVGAGRIVDQSISILPIEEQAERMAWAANAPPAAFDAAEFRQMLTDLDGATRLSVTFRFTSGTNELDQRSRRDIQRLAAALKEPELAGKRVILAGFTDASGGKFQANLAAGVKRAYQIRSALLAAAGPGIDQRLVQVKGYGPLAPVGCNGTPEGSRLNRRVEVWVPGAKEARLVR